MVGNALTTVALIARVLATIGRVGRMLFAHQVLRPAASALEAATRLSLWSRQLACFFAMISVAIVLLLASGFGLVPALDGGLPGPACIST